MERLKFDECKNCRDWSGCIVNCIDICGKPLDALEEFNIYKDLEEQGKLLKLPCAMGDTVYRVRKCEAQSCERCGGYTWVGNCYTDYIGRIFVERFGYRHLDSFGKTVFLTREEAEAVLKNYEH